VARDPYRSSKWDELTDGRDFRPSDVPALTLLVQWYQVVDQCIEDMSVGGGIQVAFSNDMGDIKALPQITTMKQASAEIRQLNKQLGINDGRDSDAEEDGGDGNVLQLVIGRGPAARRAV
jgi:hypothetical protein